MSFIFFSFYGSLPLHYCFQPMGENISKSSEDICQNTHAYSSHLWSSFQYLYTF